MRCGKTACACKLRLPNTNASPGGAQSTTVNLQAGIRAGVLDMLHVCGCAACVPRGTQTYVLPSNPSSAYPSRPMSYGIIRAHVLVTDCSCKGCAAPKQHEPKSTPAQLPFELSC